MGSGFTDVLEPKTIERGYLRNKVLAVDAFNTLYTFLTTIRGRDGTPLTTEDGTVTSHLVGIFNRFTTFMEHRMKFVFVFDGESPDLKAEEQERRRKRKEEAAEKLEEAKEEGDVKKMKKYAARATFLSQEMQEQAKELIEALGMDWIDAPSEGEAQAARLTRNGDAYGVISQDADSLLNGATRVIRNLSISGRRKMPGQQYYKQVKPELYDLKRVKDDLDVSQDQLIALAILVGTDYNRGGVKGIGPKRGLQKVQKHGDDLEAIFDDTDWEEQYPDLSWRKIYDTITGIPTTDDYTVSFEDVDYDDVHSLLVDKYDFDDDKTRGQLDDLQDELEGHQQTGLSDFT
jgi:flap endonuclease-1